MKSISPAAVRRFRHVGVIGRRFEHYLLHEAWVWEHQALVRSRAVYGDASLLADFERVRAAVLSQPREIHTLAKSVADMRDKMRKHLLRGTAEQFDLKQGRWVA